MKRFLFVVLLFITCFSLTSFSAQILLDKGSLNNIHTVSPASEDYIRYEILNQIADYNPEYTDQVNTSIMNLSSRCLDSLIINYDELDMAIANGSSEFTLDVSSIDVDNLIFVNTLTTNYNNYEKFLYDVNVNFADQLDIYLKDTSQYISEHSIKVYINKSDIGNIEVKLDENNLKSLCNYFYVSLFNRYETYMNNPDIQGVSFISTLEDISADELYTFIEDNNPNVFDANLKDLYISFVAQYINNMKITNVVFGDNENNHVLPSEATNITISYDTQDGGKAIEYSITMLLDEYITSKQVPKDRTGVIDDMTRHIKNYVISEDSAKENKRIVLSGISISDKNTLLNKAKLAMTEDLFYSMQSLSSIAEEKWQLINENYFFKEKLMEKTLCMYNAYQEADYRVLEIKSDLDNDAYVKIHAYNTETKATGDVVYSAYLLADDSIQTALPEGDYIFRYATGETWYGAVYMFADKGQYMAVSDVLSFHEEFLKTTIVLGKPEDNSLNTTPLEADGF